MTVYRKRFINLIGILIIVLFAFIGLSSNDILFSSTKKETLAVSVKKKEFLPKKISASVEKLDVREESQLMFENLTVEQVAEQLNNFFNEKGVFNNKGIDFATIAMNYDMDPFISAAIAVHETGNGTSALARKNNNVGGVYCSRQKKYCSYSTIDIGIKSFIDNIYKNYYSIGKVTIDDMASKYATATTWAQRVKNHYNAIRK